MKTLPIATLLAVGLVWADTVELKTGERLDGTFRQANAAGVVIEAAGQPLTIPLDKVRAIYLGSAGPETQHPANASVAIQEALDALKSLRSATNTGVVFRDYAQLVLDSAIRVDRALESARNEPDPRRQAIQAAMAEYEFARDVWHTTLNILCCVEHSERIGQSIRKNARLSNCPPIKAILAKTRTTDPKALGTEAILAGAEQNIQSSLWQCAAEQIADAER